MMRWTLWAPLLLFAFFLGLAGYQLFQPKDEFIPSTMIGRSLPEFSLEPASEARPGVTLADFKDGTPKLLNIWASWCLPCIAEAPHLEALNEAGVEIIGVAIRDKREDVDQFLATHGNPYSRIGSDEISAIQLEIGSSGVPETFVIDGNGVITHQHIGDVRADDVPELLEELREAAE
jgi:cytochrome c biogenesis protein CcmG/thiol:disulfide interchange protein DsbE